MKSKQIARNQKSQHKSDPHLSEAQAYSLVNACQASVQDEKEGAGGASEGLRVKVKETQSELYVSGQMESDTAPRWRFLMNNGKPFPLLCVFHRPA